MKKLISILTVFFPLLAFAGYMEHFTDQGLRLDYYHGGDGATQTAYLASLSQVPLFAGNRTNLVDTFGYGAYRVVVTDNRNTEIYSRGFCTLFNEWVTTREADTVSRIFRESIILPFPSHKVHVRILYRDNLNQWQEMLSTWIDPGSLFIRKEKKGNDETSDILINGDVSEKVDLVFLSEGYVEGQKQEFLDDCQMFTAYLLGCSPFSERKADFNVRAVWVPGADTATDIPGTGYWARTPFNSSFYTFGSERYLTVQDYWSVMDHACNVPFDQVIVMVNSTKYGGGGVYNFFTVASVHHPSSDFLLVHEFGHAFAGLGDEYFATEVAVEDFYPLGTEPWEPNLTTLVAFDTKWRDMLEPGTPVPTPADPSDSPDVGVFEGGGYVAHGVYRPSYNCTMRSVRYDDFCPVCTRAINRMIDWEVR